MASEILSEVRYNYYYGIGRNYVENKLNNSSSSISEGYINAFASAYSEAYNKANFGNNRIRYIGASDAELINWVLSRGYLLSVHDKYFSQLEYADNIPVPNAFNEIFKQILFDNFFIEDDNGVFIENPNTPFEVNPNRVLSEEERNRLIEHLNRENIPYPLRNLFEDFGFTGGAAPIQTDPLLIDLDGNGIKTTTVNEGRFFDHQSDGFKELSAWVSNEDGILYIDKNNNGIIDNGSELFGENYVKSDSTNATTGFDALADLDSNNDSVIDSSDTQFSNLKIQKGDGTILTLEEAGISSINLDFQNVNQTDENGNTQIESGTFVKTDGTVGELGSYALQMDYTNSIAGEYIEVSSAVEILPDIVGYGKVYDLHQAIMRDTTGELKTLVETFISSNTSESNRDSLLDQILFKWTNCETVIENSRGENINAKELAVVEAFMGKEFYSTYDAEHEDENTNPSNPNLQAGNLLETIYQKLKAYIYAELVGQSIVSDLIALIDFNENGYDLTDVVSQLQEEMQENYDAGRQRVLQFAKVIKGLAENTNFFDPKDDSCFYTIFTKDDRELKWLIDTIGKVPFEDEIGDGEGSAADDSYRLEEQGHFHSLSGDDVAYGSDGDDSFAMCSGDDLVDAGNGNDIIDTHGGNDIVYAGAGNDIIHASDGNDIIYGGEGDDTIYPDHGDDFSWDNYGNDTIRGGKGNDTIISMSGDDTFIFNLGDGQDTIEEHQGVDTLYFGNGIEWSDLSFTQSGNDMVISINDTTDKITVKDWFIANDDGVYRYDNHKIEMFEFADGSKHTKDEITVGNNTESITYNMSELEEHIDLASGYKTTVNLKEGWNDIVAGQNSNDTYVLSQEFSDVLIEDYSGNNKIVFDNENITLANTFFAYNEEGLEVWFDYFESHLQINGNNFSFEFSDNTIITDISQYLTRDVSYTDYIMGDNLPELALLGYDSVTVNDSNIDSHITLNYGDTTVDFGQNYTHIDSLYGGNDTYIYNIGDGNKYIVDLGGNDTIQFGVGITQENIRFLKDLQNNNLEIWFDIESDVDNSLTIENFFNNDNKIENFVFSDGSTITDVTPYINAYGSQHYSDLILPDNIQEAHLRGEGHTTAIGNDYDNHFNGNEGDNTFIGGQGNDSFHDDCETSERYIYNLGDGSDFIYDLGGIDAIIFGDGITKENIRFNKEPENLVIWFDIEGHENDTLSIGDYFIDDNNKIELIKFADGSVIENLHQYVSEIYSRDENIIMDENIVNAGLWDNADLSVTGNGLDNLIMGNAGNNTFEGKSGNDTIIDDQGGNDTYIYNLGDGDDHIFDVDGTDKIVFGEGITTQNLVFTQEDNHLIISFAQNEGSIFVENYFGDDINKIETFELSDGTIINDISSYLVNSGETNEEPETQQPDNQENNQSQEPEQAETTTPENNSYTYTAGSGDLYIADNGGSDTLSFGQGISLDNINFLKSQTNLHIWINDYDGTIQIENYFSDDNSRIESFIFSDGTVLTDISDYIIAYGSEESIVLDEGLREAHLWGNENTTALGNSLDNHFNGNEGNNTFHGSGGNDSFYDDYHTNETYIYNKNNGYDYITDIGGIDTIKFGRDIFSGSTRFERIENNLLISFYDFDGSIEIENYFLNDNYKIENFVFYDGETLTDISDRLTGIAAFENYTIAEDSNIEIVRMAGDGSISVTGNSGDNNIEGNSGNNTFEGKQGDDSLIDITGGNDTYIYNIGDGNDFIYDLGGNDTVKFGSDVNLDNLAFMQTSADLNIWFMGIDNQGLTIKDFFSDPAAKIENFELADGTVITDITNYIKAIGTDENISLPSGVDQANTWGENDISISGNDNDNWLGGNAGNNTITGGKGDDYLYDDQSTNETYIYNLGDGYDVIDDFGGFDTIKFGSGIAQENLIFRKNNGDLIINFVDSNVNYYDGEIRVLDYFNDDNKRIQNIEFADGSSLSDIDSRLAILCGDNDLHNYMNLPQIELWGEGDHKVTGEYCDEIVFGNSGNNTYDTKGGTDYIYDDQGGNDTYIYNHDYNDKFILDIGGNNDSIKFGTGINIDNTRFIKEDNHLRIYFPESGDGFIRIENYFLDNDHKIENFVFADNTTITDVTDYLSGQASSENISLNNDEQFAYLLGDSVSSVYGSTNSDSIYGNSANNTYYANQGDDHIEDKFGGNDTYIYNIGDGHDFIIDIGGSDTVKFGEGISLQNVRFTHKNNDLQVFVDIGENGGSVYIENYFKSDMRKIESFEFYDGTIITDVTNLISGISIDSDYTFEENSQITEVYMKGSENLAVTGNSSDNHVEGNSGSNTYQGKGGNDYFYDPAGDDTYIYNLGDGWDTINDENGNDSIQFGAGITLDSIGFMKDDYNNMHIKINDENGSEILIEGQLNEGEQGIETIKFADNSVITNINSFVNQIGTEFDNIVLPDNYLEAHLWGTSDLNATGNALDNFMRGNSGNNILNGKTGDDYYWEFEGGNDTYIYNVGDGHDYIADISGNDTIQFGEGISSSNIQFAHNQDNYNHLEISFNGLDGGITVEDYFDENQNKKIETFTFSDGTTISDISSYLNPAPDEYEDEEEPALPLPENNEQNYDINLLIQEMNSYAVDNDVVLTDIQNQNNEDILLAMAS